MPPLAWDQIMSVNLADLKPDDVDNLFDVLKEGDPSSENDPDKLKKLFKVTREIMISKHEDSEEAMAEAEKEAEQSEKKEKELKSKITKLNKELEEVKTYGPADKGSGGATSRDARYLRDQIRDYDDQIQQLQADNRDLQRDLSNEKRAAEKYSEKINELEEELGRLRKDNDQYRQDISDYMMQLQAQRENLVARRGDDQDVRDKMSKKNRELAEAMEELQNLTDNNELLQKRCEELETNLSEANDQMFKAAEDYQKIKMVLQQSDDVTDKLRQDNEILKAQVEDLTEEVQSKTESDDAIMVAVNNKIEEWKILMSDKDQQISELREQVFKLREQLIAANMDTDKASVAALSQATKDKDKQIEELTEKISQYVSDMEANAAIIEDLRNELNRGGKGTGDRYVTKVRELQNEVKENRETMKNRENDAKKAEEDARIKDQELSEVLERMRQYEAGEYGLQEAVAEIKEGKTQVKVRDRQIEELTKHVNQAELRINDILDENEELRYKLGMDPKEPIDLTEFRKNKATRKEEEKALNFILQREIERLEEERIDLKKKIRKLAQQTGQRAVALGLTAEDMMAVQDFTEDLKYKNQTKTESVATIIRREVAKEEKVIRSHELKNDYQRNLQDLDHVHEQNAELKARTNQLNEENQYLKDSVKEVLLVLKEKVTDGKIQGSAIELPTVDRMLAALEAKRVIGGHDTSGYMKEQFDIMRGRNEELRNELRESRVETTKNALERDKAFDKIKQMEKDNLALQESGVAPGVFQALPLPEGMTITSTEIISSLNEHLVITLQEMSLKDANIKKMEAALESYKRKFGVLRHQQGLVYSDYLQDKKTWQEEVKSLQEQIKKLHGLREEDGVKIQEFDRLTDTLGHDDVEVRRRLAEMTRKITVLRVNEKALTRRHAIMEEIENTLRMNLQNLNNDMGQMETAISERMGYLQRYKDMASFKIGALQKALDDSVPSSDLDKVNRQYHELTEKYRDLLEKGNNLVNKAEAVIGLENEVKRLTETNEEIKKTMGIEKEKLHALEAAMEELHRRGVTDGSDVKVTDSDIISISKKITMLEMKELNERQRAEHAVRMYEQQKNILHDLETRNKTLEDKFADTTKMNLEMQKVERDLRDELTNSVSKVVSDADRKKIAELEESGVMLRQEISKLKEISEVAGSQVKTLEMQHVSREKECKSLRQQLVDFQMQSDEKTIIGKLHRHIVQLQVSEGMAIKKWEEAKKKITKREAHVLRLEQRLDEKDKTIYHNRTEAQNKCRYLKRSLQELRIQFAGAVPLSKQERFSKLMVNLQNDKSKLELEMRDIRKQKEDMEDEVAALKLKHESVQELINTLKDGHGAAKVKEWHGKMDAIRLEELRLKRQTTKLNGQIRYLEDIIRSHEVTITDLEADYVRLTKDYEERQLIWEQREVELERNITQLERNASQIAGAASQFEEALGNLPDAKLPVANQLEQAITTIRSNVKIILDTQAESKHLKQRVAELEKNLRNAEHTVIQRDKLVSELRLRMPATADRDEIILKATAKTAESAIHTHSKNVDFEETQALRIAQSTINSLKQRIQQKEETIIKYQELLNQAREDMQEMNRRHEEELKSMQQKIHLKTDDAFNKFKEATQALMHKQMTSRGPTDKQLLRLHELEDMVAESDNALAALSEKLRRRESEIDQLRVRLHQTEKQHFTEKEKVTAVFKVEDEKKGMQNDESRRIITELKKEIEILNEEINTLKDSNNRAPTTTMKNLVERLKNQLALKEKQHQALSKALTELRADMVAQAQETVKSNLEDVGQEKNIQRLIDQQTKQLNVS
ncbi:centrosomal protein of 290 kDa [Patella vulgata]|uniref:centrosomal protein of 290 kDa n=1 Tax=Patella vulgata TaxID=6465 RepID=UPI0024A8F244|nr:centrosomal protein of 290 kDa [Patella vulgata]